MHNLGLGKASSQVVTLDVTSLSWRLKGKQQMQTVLCKFASVPERSPWDIC